VLKKEEQDRSVDQYTVSWDCKLAGESQRATMTKMRFTVRASSNFAWLIKTYMRQIYIYIRGVDIFIRRTDKNINHLLTD
jgi:hypothetical protein